MNYSCNRRKHSVGNRQDKTFVSVALCDNKAIDWEQKKLNE